MSDLAEGRGEDKRDTDVPSTCWNSIGDSMKREYKRSAQVALRATYPLKWRIYAGIFHLNS